MMETKHTPGPWRFYTEPQPNGCPIIGSGNGMMVAMLAHTVKQANQKDEAIANARLIAAAPELLDALRDLLEAAEEAWPSDRPCVRIAREAIAKATGA